MRRRIRRCTGLVLCVVATVAGLAACPGKDAVVVASGDAGTGSGSGGQGSGGRGGSGTTCEFGGPCEACTQEQCRDELAECCSTVGCFSIVLCSLTHDCLGLDCYGADTCRDLIDQYRGPFGETTFQAAFLGGCMFEHCAQDCGVSGAGGGTGGLGGGGATGTGGSGGQAGRQN